MTRDSVTGSFWTCIYVGLGKCFSGKEFFQKKSKPDSDKKAKDSKKGGKDKKDKKGGKSKKSDYKKKHTDTAHPAVAK